MQGDLEPERIAVVDHPPAPVLEDPRACRPTCERCDHALDIDARLQCKHDALRHTQVRTAQDHLVDGFGHLSRADRPKVGDTAAHGMEHVVCPFDICGLPADHDRQRPGHSALRTS